MALNGSSEMDWKALGFTGPLPKRVAIVGLGPSSLHYIQDVDRAGDRKKIFDETWTFNSYASVIEADRIFHMDDFKVQELRAKNNPRVANMLEALKRCKVPIYTSFAEPEYPTSIDFPLERVIEAFNTTYFTTTPPFAAALAALMGVEEVMLYGMDYTWPGIAGAERGRACMEYWVGRLQGWRGKYELGVRVGVQHQSSLMDSRLSTWRDVKVYGYDRVRISIEDMGGGQVRLVFSPKELPTAEEIEARYFQQMPGSDVAVNVTE